MFTGIIQDIGTLSEIVKQGDWMATIETEALDLSGAELGASISCAGVCLTVIAKEPTSFKVQISPETLSVTTLGGWQVGTRLNLERALRLGDELGGHLVAGHVDGVAHLTARSEDQESVRLRFSPPLPLMRYMAPKGSVVLDGVSLTVNEVGPDYFGVNLIPHTQNVTTIGHLREGDPVNIEVDLLARYIDRLLQAR